MGCQCGQAIKNAGPKSSVGVTLMSVPPNSAERFLTDHLQMRVLEAADLDVHLNLAQVVFWPGNGKS